MLYEVAVSADYPPEILEFQDLVEDPRECVITKAWLAGLLHSCFLRSDERLLGLSSAGISIYYKDEGVTLVKAYK